MTRLVRRLQREWRAENARCDHRAIFTIAYKRISRRIRVDLLDHRLFRFRPWFISVVQAFSNEYFATRRRNDSGKPVPEAWQIYYQEMASGNDNAGQDLLLASNAHTNHDLPYAYAAAGLFTRGGHSRKHDHDAVNQINSAVFKGLADYYAAHYDPFFNAVNVTYPFDKVATLQVVQRWRADAWQEAKALVHARTPAARAAVEQRIETNSTSWANMIRSFQEPGYRAMRDAYCRSHRA